MFERIKRAIFRRLARALKESWYGTPYFYGQCEIRLGKNVDVSNTIFNLRSGKIIIGDNVIFGHDVLLLTGYHDYNVLGSRRPTLTDANRDITIGNNAWIASGVIVIGPVIIGENSVIGAGSVVTKDVPERVLVAGNPSRIVKNL